jgi:iron complex transport system substrate-binding protein
MSMTRWTAFRVSFLVVLLITGICSRAFSFPERVADDRKKEIDIPAKPNRIISLAPTNTELLFALGLDKEIVGDTEYCDYPEAAKGKEKVGGFADVDVERIVALRPDLVLAFGTVQLPVVETLEKRGLKVFWLYPHSVNDILDSFERVGKITGRVTEAKVLRDSVVKGINDLQRTLGALPEEKRPTVFRVMGFSRAATIGADSFQNDLFQVAGGRNAFPVAGKDYFEMDARELKERDPAVLLVCGDDEKELKRKLRESPVYRDLSAVRNDRVLVMPCELTCRPGPRIGDAALRLAQYLHPVSQVTVPEEVHGQEESRTVRQSSGDCGCSAK